MQRPYVYNTRISHTAVELLCGACGSSSHSYLLWYLRRLVTRAPFVVMTADYTMARRADCSTSSSCRVLCCPILAAYPPAFMALGRYYRDSFYCGYLGGKSARTLVSCLLYLPMIRYSSATDVYPDWTTGPCSPRCANDRGNLTVLVPYNGAELGLQASEGRRERPYHVTGTT